MLKKSWPIISLAVLLVIVVGVSSYIDAGNQQESANYRPSPSGVAQSDAIQSRQNLQQTQHAPFVVRMFKWPEGITAIFVLLTLFFIAWQAFLTQQAITSSDAASQVELRAYLTVLINVGSYQDRDKEIKFEGTPALKNTGKTPAHNVRYRTNSAILENAEGKTYSYPPGDEVIGGYVLGIDQTYKISVVHREYCDAQDVDKIMRGIGRAFFYWGIVYYDDAFGKSHSTEFCHRLYFYEDSGVWKVNGNYVAGRNSAT